MLDRKIADELALALTLCAHGRGSADEVVALIERLIDGIIDEHKYYRRGQARETD